MTYARKVDSSQADIVKALRQAGVKVWVIHEPCDLLCYLWSNPLQSYRWQVLECKPLTGKTPHARRRADQPEQTRFLEETQTPVVATPLEALAALGLV